MKDETFVLFVYASDRMRREFIEALRTNEKEFGLALDDTTVERLADFYELVQQHNQILHLVAPCSPQEFATRHILESLTLLNHLPKASRFGDVGPGAGLPSIPCLIVRDDLKGVLIESKKKKTAFLELVVSNLLEPRRVEVIGLQFEEVRDHRLRIVTCRALDKFVDKMPRLVKWSKGAKLLLFGGNTLRDVLDKLRIEFVAEKMPLSERRFLFVTKNRYRR